LLRGQRGREGAREAEKKRGGEKERVGTRLLHVLTVTRFAPGGRARITGRNYQEE